jgi:hypothetical protein
MTRWIPRLVIAALLAAAAIGAGAAASALQEQDEAGEELEEFIPSEEVPADSAVAFPVDI